MFDLNDEETGSVRKRAYRSPIPNDEPPKPVEGNKLDSTEHVALYKRLLDLYVREVERQNENRIEMATDEDFYDNIQWREEDAQVLRERGQMPLVYNVISASIDWICGTEKRGRADHKVLPRRKEEGAPAERKTALLKYLSDVNRSGYHWSRAFEDAVKGGLGWIEDGYSDDGEEEPIYRRYENWRNVIYDSAATENDLSDGRYIFRTKWVDLDIACSLFPKRKGLLLRSAEQDETATFIDDYGDEVMDMAENEMRDGQFSRADRTSGYQRRRVRLIEAWYRSPVSIQRLKGGPFHGEIYDPYSPGHHDSVHKTGEAEIVQKMTMRVHVAIMTTQGLLWKSESPYRHNRFPLTPVWGYRRGRDGLPYGVIRRVRDIQEDINKRASKALHILSTNRVIMDEGAVDDMDELLEEVSRPDGVIVKKPNKQLDISADRELSQYQMELMSQDIRLVQSSTGVTDENLGRRTNAVSGAAITARQSQGSMTTAKLFDNLRFARQVAGENQLSLVEQFMSERKAFRITGKRGQPEYVEINDGLPDNDIVHSKADFVLDEGDWRATLRQAAAEQLLEVMSRFPPDVAIIMLDLVVDNLDLPNRAEIARRIRAVSGQRDPDQEEPTEEDKARAAQQAKQQQMQEAMAVAGLRKVLAEIGETEAKAAKAKADAGKSDAQTVRENIESLGGPKRGAIDVAATVMTAPEVTPVSDKIMHEAGFVSRSEKERAAEAQAEAAKQEQIRQQMGQQAAIAPGLGSQSGGPAGI